MTKANDSLVFFFLKFRSCVCGFFLLGFVNVERIYKKLYSRYEYSVQEILLVTRTDVES